MGARSTIVVQDGADRVYLYGHWMGCAAALHAARGLRSDRFDDPAYLARVVFCSMVGADVEGETGYGISSTLLDTELPVLVIDVHRTAAGGTCRGRADVWFESRSGRRLSDVLSREHFLAIAGTTPRFDPCPPEGPGHTCAYTRLLDDEPAGRSGRISDV